MAYITDENAQLKEQQTAGPNQGPVSTSAAPNAGPAGSKTPTGAVGNKAPAQPFTNLQSYLTANAPQIQNQANTIAGNLGTQYGEVQNAIDTGVGGFKNDVAAGYTAPNAQVVQQAAENPTEFVKDHGNVDAFQKQLNNAYTGPSNFESTDQYGGLNAKVDKASQNAKLFDSSAGIQTYFQNTGNNRTKGENVLDATLLRGSPEAIQKVKGASSQFSQLPEYLSGTVDTANQDVTAAKKAAQESADYASNRFIGSGGVAPSFQSELDALLPEAQQKINTYNSGVNQNREALNPLNTTLNSFNESSGLGVSNPLTEYLSQQPYTKAATLSNVASGGQYSKDAALEQLLGDLYNPRLNPNESGQAGTFNVPELSHPDIKNLVHQIALEGTNKQSDYLKTQPAMGPAAGLDINKLFGTSLGDTKFVDLSPDALSLHSLYDTHMPAYQKFINALQLSNPDIFGQVKLNGEATNPGNYIQLS